MTLTLDLPETVKMRLEADAKEQGRPVAEVAAERLTDVYGPLDADNLPPMSAEDKAAIAEGLADMQAGRGVTLDSWRTEWQEKRAALLLKAQAEEGRESPMHE